MQIASTIMKKLFREIREGLCIIVLIRKPSCTDSENALPVKIVSVNSIKILNCKTLTMGICFKI